MLTTGVFLALSLVLAISGIWIKLPWWAKLLTLWSPLLTDLALTITVMLLTASISSSIPGLTAGLIAGIIFSMVLFFGQKPLRQYAIREGLQSDGWLSRRVLQPVNEA